MLRSFSAWLTQPMPVPEAAAGPIDRVRYRIYKNRRTLKQFTKFALVGTLGALIDFTVLNILVLGFGWPKVAANTVSFTAAVLSNFTWNRLWTFPGARHQPLLPQLGQFVLVNLAGLFINQIVFITLDVYVFEPWLGPLGFNVAKACAIVVVLFWNFFINRLWTFRHAHKH